MCNPLGAAKGVHKEMGVQVAIGNLCAEERFKKTNIMMPVLVPTKVYNKHGLSRCISGIDSAGKQHPEPCFAKDMRELDVGVPITIPDDENGGVRTIVLKAWVVLLAGDYLGDQAMLPFVETCGAHVLCRGCDFNRSTPDSIAQTSKMRLCL